MTAAACTQPQEVRQKMAELRAEFAARMVRTGVEAWTNLSLETRVSLLLLAGIDGGSDLELYALAGRDWREFTPAERGAIKGAADELRWQLNTMRSLPTV